MIVCTRCGSPNADESRACEKCGHKLQSGRRGVAGGAPAGEMPRELRPLQRRGLLAGMGKYLEAWVLVLALCAAIAYALYSRNWVPVYVVGAVTALTALARGL